MAKLGVPSAGWTGNYVETITASKTLSYIDSGKVFLVGTDALTITLPATKTGVKYTFVNSGAAGNNIITISPNSSDAIKGNLNSSVGANANATTADGLVAISGGADDKDWVNTKATANVGDRVTIVGDGTDGWWIVDGCGIWVSEA
jgi:hypothetical protein